MAKEKKINFHASFDLRTLRRIRTCLLDSIERLGGVGCIEHLHLAQEIKEYLEKFDNGQT